MLQRRHLAGKKLMSLLLAVLESDLKFFTLLVTFIFHKKRKIT